MMTLLTTPGIKLMGAARLEKEQRVGEGCRKEKGGKGKMAKGRKGRKRKKGERAQGRFRRERRR